MKNFENPRRVVLLAGPLLVLLLVSGCGGSAKDSSGDSLSGSAGSSAGGSTAADAAQLTEGESGAADTSSRQPAKNAVSPISRAVISTGSITLHSAKVASARAEVMRLVASWGGTVSDERSESDRSGRITDSTMTLRIPTVRFDAAMGGLAEVADVAHQSRTSEDVTTQVIDNQARVRAAQRSIRAIEDLLGRATRLSDVISIESDLARRQADLDSLEQQQAWLSDQTSLSTIAVHLSRTAPPVAKRTEAHGFLAGLGHGWSALQAASSASLTVVGAVLPFALLAGLVGAPLWVVVRRRRHTGAPRPEVAV